MSSQAPTSILHIQKVGQIAGSENHLLSLLPGLLSKGYDPTMLVLANQGSSAHSQFVQRMEAAGVKTSVIETSSHFDVNLLIRLVPFIKKGNFDIVHTHLIHADLYGALAARLAGVRKVVTTRHNDNDFRRRQPWNFLCSNSAIYLSDGIICVSEHIQRFAETVENIPSPKIQVIYNGFRPTISANSSRRWRYEQGWNDRVPVLGIVARLIPQKGHSTLLHAMTSVVKNFPDAKLVVVGDGKLRHALQALAQELKIENHVFFLGYREDAAEMMVNFDIFVHPSRWEGFGIVFLEAMAARVPVIATHVSAIPEIVKDEKTGLLVPVDDWQALAQAICRLLSDRELAKQMGEAGYRRWQEYFSVELMVEKTCLFYESLLASTN